MMKTNLITQMREFVGDCHGNLPSFDINNLMSLATEVISTIYVPRSEYNDLPRFIVTYTEPKGRGESE